MKRVKRNAEKFDVPDLYAALAREQNYESDITGDQEEFISRVRRSLAAAKTNQILLHGKRVEAMFASVAGALGECRLIKQEDAGDAFSDDPELLAPDYRLILKDGKQFFVEVKNCNFQKIRSKFEAKRKYWDRLKRYADLHHVPLRIAIYFTLFRKWVLLSEESFDAAEHIFSIDMITAIARNEMSTLGDRTLATLPNLEFHMLGESLSEIEKEGGREIKFVTRAIKFYCNEVEIVDDAEKNIAFYLMRFGEWNESEHEVLYRDGKFSGAKFCFTPEADSGNDDQPFKIIGTLSSMVSMAFSEQTVRNQKVIALSARQDPEVFSLHISQDYRGNALPLWQFSFLPNPDFVLSSNISNG